MVQSLIAFVVALGAIGAVLWVIAFIVDNDSPGAEDSDAKIQAFFASSSHRTRRTVVIKPRPQTGGVVSRRWRR